MTADVLGALGTANLQLGRLGQAEKQLRDAIELDEDYFEAWNNLGVVLLETDRTPEAVQILRKAFALSNGDSDEIRDNLRLALAKFDNSQYTEEQNTYKLVGRGGGNYLLRTTP
jgi:Flp pilus assembly protein TadD